MRRVNSDSRRSTGVYSLEVQLPNFTTYREDDIAVDVQGHVERAVVLTLTPVIETVTVAAGSPLDQERSGIASGFGPQELASIPVRRFSMFELHSKPRPVCRRRLPSSGTGQ